MSYNKIAVCFFVLIGFSNVAAQVMVLSHGLLSMTRLDPIVNPGTVSGHMHSIVGGSAFGSLYDGPSYVNAKCTTASVGKDKSNYWTPTLYFKNNDGTVAPIPLQYVNTYYNNRFSDKDPFPNQVFPFPPGFSMLGGNAVQRADGTEIKDRAQSYNCYGASGPETRNFPSLNGKKCSVIRAQINMPNCWDGVRATSSDNSHVSYPIGDKENGVCPAGFKRIPAIFYEFLYDTAKYDTANGKYILANGDETGYSFHGDFANGWDQTLLEDIVKNCYGSKSTYGRNQCPTIAAAEALTYKNCQPDGQIADEPNGLTAALKELPGCQGCGQAVPAIKNLATGVTVAPAAAAPAPAPVAAPVISQQNVVSSAPAVSNSVQAQTTGTSTKIVNTAPASVAVGSSAPAATGRKCASKKRKRFARRL